MLPHSDVKKHLGLPKKKRTSRAQGINFDLKPADLKNGGAKGANPNILEANEFYFDNMYPSPLSASSLLENFSKAMNEPNEE